jgi:amino-acid N-acetyltransferase
MDTTAETTVITAVEPREWPALAALLTQTGLPTAGLADHLATTRVARADGAVVGSVGLELYGEAALLRSVAVAPAQRGQGLGGRLVEAALDLAQAHGVRTLYLLTETADDYFARRGFVPVARSEVAPAVTASVEFTAACPASARVMQRQLTA